MTHTFLVTLDDDESDFFAQALDLEEELSKSGFSVTSVKPGPNTPPLFPQPL